MATSDDATTTTMDMSKLQDEVDALNAQITKQGATVRQLKKDGCADAAAIDEAVAVLQALKISAAEKSTQLEADTPQFNRKSFDDLIIRKMFVVPSFGIHGGVKGLFDLGPPACGLKVRACALQVCAFASMCMLCVCFLCIRAARSFPFLAFFCVMMCRPQ